MQNYPGLNPPARELAKPQRHGYTRLMLPTPAKMSMRPIAFGFLVVLVLLCRSSCGETRALEGPTSTNPAPFDTHRTIEQRDWYYFIAAVNVYPALASEELINKTLEPVLRTLAPGHEGVYTVSDLRDDHGLWPPHVGLGVNLSPHWSVFLEAGYTAGKVRTKDDRRSLVLLPLHTDFEIQRSALFGGVGLDYFPWGMVEQKEYSGLRDRLAHIRPFMGTRLTWTHATFRAKVKLGLLPLPNFLNLELADAWSLPSATLVGGFDVPLSRDTTLTFNGGYNYFWDREFDFEGYAFTVQWRRYFNGPRLRRSPARHQ